MKKSLIFIYGILAYAIFFLTFLYAIGFVGNIIVPKSIDSGTEGPVGQAIFIDLLLLSVFAIQHSVMARPAFKNKWTKLIGKAAERSTYVLFSSLALILIFWQWQPIKIIIWEVQNQVAYTGLMVVYFLGWLIVLLSTFMINHFELFGLQQIYFNLKNKKARPSKFQQNFLYKFIRHPIMLGFIIAFWATPVMSLGHLIFAITTTLYIYIAVKYLEEPELSKNLGKDYMEYQLKTPMFFPFFKRKA